MAEGMESVATLLPEAMAVIGRHSPDDRVREAVTAVLRKARVAAINGAHEHVDVLARTALSYIVGPQALHDFEEWKTEEKYSWAIDQLDETLKS